VEFVVRPHPGEEQGAYSELKGLENLSFSYDGEFTEALQGVDAMFAFNSTSIFEAMALGIPYYNLALIELEDKYHPPITALFRWLRKDEFFGCLGKLTDGGGRKLDENILGLAREYISYFAGNSLLRNTIAIRDAAERAKAEGSRLSVYDRLLGKIYCNVPLAKDWYVKIGHALKAVTGMENIISTYAEKRWTDRVRRSDMLDEERVSQAMPLAETIIHDEELEVLSKREYELVRTDDGIVIELPARVEDVAQH